MIEEKPFEYFSVDAGFADSAAKIAARIKALVKNEKVILLCVGTDKVCGDSLGPMVGGLVQQRALRSIYVYGLPESNVTAKNLSFAVKFIETIHPDRILVVVDAALGTREQVGTVQIIKGGLRPGTATNKNLPKVGDVGVLGVVDEFIPADVGTLNSVKMNTVRFIAAAIANGLCEAFGATA